MTHREREGSLSEHDLGPQRSEPPTQAEIEVAAATSPARSVAAIHRAKARVARLEGDEGEAQQHENEAMGSDVYANLVGEMTELKQALPTMTRENAQEALRTLDDQHEELLQEYERLERTRETLTRDEHARHDRLYHWFVSGFEKTKRHALEERLREFPEEDRNSE